MLLVSKCYQVPYIFDQVQFLILLTWIHSVLVHRISAKSLLSYTEKVGGGRLQCSHSLFLGIQQSFSANQSFKTGSPHVITIMHQNLKYAIILLQVDMIKVPGRAEFKNLQILYLGVGGGWLTSAAMGAILIQAPRM